MKRKLSHTDRHGRARMVDVAKKAVTARMARAEAVLRMRPETLASIMEGTLPKGDVLAVARIAGIQAAKRTHELIPLCHALMISSVAVDFRRLSESELRVETCAKCDGKTGVEMEALVAASLAALTVYDMVKAIDRGVTVNGLRLIEKSGGKSGHYQNEK